MSRRAYFREMITAHSMPVPEAGCWLWLRSVTAGGYGQFRIGNEHHYAHRASYEGFVGPISARLYVCHRCDVRCCVNPYHLFAGTASDNNRDAMLKGRKWTPNWRGEQCPYAILTNAAVLDIRSRRLSQRQFAKFYGVSLATITHANTGRNWSHV